VLNLSEAHRIPRTHDRSSTIKLLLKRQENMSFNSTKPIRATDKRYMTKSSKIQFSWFALQSQITTNTDVSLDCQDCGSKNCCIETYAHFSLL
jgi:hypothetical protein